MLGPETDLTKLLFKTGREDNYLTDGFLDILFLNGLSPLGILFLI
jgi:hypothetical protein